MDSGDLATWVGSSFAAIAAGATLWTLKSQRDQIGEQRQFIAEQSATLALERQELLASAQDRREDQARKIELEVTPSYVKVRNRSDDPLAEVHCLEDGQPPVRAASARAEGAEASLSMVLEQLQGQEQHHLDTLGVGRIGWFQRRSDPSRTGAVEIAFTDAAGVHWTKTHLGELRQVG
ncbi:hypothetical protein OG331_47450 [Streptomyces sp. NBC_01017]|uniref:hypothetical protein n=1 Tax=Streptomyces sp. NBC_01017 TaxID=2903721 RepID=UPI003866761C|nr:hypothetical protein OG331_04530 [Streptomyces sp. NBC_01017]WSV34713.1 hypothetical protein OG331_47450 [Streptomyces sp. NBC_01017]